MMGRRFYVGAMLIGFGLGFLLPLPLALLASIPAGFVWADYCLRRDR